MNLNGKSLLTLLDYEPEEIEYILNMAAEFKERKKAGIAHRICEGKNIALIFEKNSTRTRCAFETAASDLGIHAVYIDSKSTHMGTKESIKDTARVLGRMYDGIEYRGYSQSTAEQLAVYSDVPVWNGLTDKYHPTQALADLLTVHECFGNLAGRKLVYMGDARNNVANSLMVGCAKMGLNYTACAPEKYFPDSELTAKCKKIAEKSGGSISFETEPMRAVKNADVIYTDVWVSMGESDGVWEERIRELYPYRVTAELMEHADPQCRFMHCLPAFHNTETDTGRKLFKKFGISSMEVDDDVFEGSQSVVFDQAENRMHTIKAVLAAGLCNDLAAIE